MSNTHENNHPFPRFARFLRAPHVRLHLTFGHLWRLIIVFLLTTLFVLGAWAGSVPAAYAASLVQQPTPTPQVASTRSTQPTSSPRATPSTPLRPTPPSRSRLRSMAWATCPFTPMCITGT
jgi:hypothetical protein